MNDVREAAERLRRFNHELTQGTVVESGQVDYDGVEDARITLAEAYLSEHPADDDEVITEEWLRSVATDIHKALNQLAFGCRAPNVARIICWPADDCFQWFIDENGANPIPVKPPATRGDLRQLCRALAIELKETQCEST